MSEDEPKSEDEPTAESTADESAADTVVRPVDEPASSPPLEGVGEAARPDAGAAASAAEPVPITTRLSKAFRAWTEVGTTLTGLIVVLGGIALATQDSFGCKDDDSREAEVEAGTLVDPNDADAEDAETTGAQGSAPAATEVLPTDDPPGDDVPDPPACPNGTAPDGTCCAALRSGQTACVTSGDCADLLSPQHRGTYECTACVADTSQCFIPNNGVAEGSEVCDGVDVRGAVCPPDRRFGVVECTREQTLDHTWCFEENTCLPTRWEGEAPTSGTTCPWHWRREGERAASGILENARNCFSPVESEVLAFAARTECAECPLWRPQRYLRLDPALLVCPQQWASRAGQGNTAEAGGPYVSYQSVREPEFSGWLSRTIQSADRFTREATHPDTAPDAARESSMQAAAAFVLLDATLRFMLEANRNELGTSQPMLLHVQQSLTAAKARRDLSPDESLAHACAAYLALSRFDRNASPAHPCIVGGGGPSD